ncbi:hypothetical protein [Candidatus Kinetoplastidibacterium galati]|uniref:Ubiquinone biosynthesis accessory factor UbiJ n=1 Tax=Candidatus Kinetoplastidibacterium galati TCC219 TaxID=1208921 RepID=M1L891_9PROT|nr:hypothetical protein [Candidatus Kinetoplastibacterium galatii]AGF48788.1 hypothetical protein ST1E_0306 [Candidatus Kinetoplastibacterium galatii TCC219]
MSHSFINKLVFIINQLFNRNNDLSSILRQHVGKVLEININNYLLRFIVNNEGMFEVNDYSHKNPNMVVTCNESIIKMLKSANNFDISYLSKFVHVSGDLQFMNDMSILLSNIERDIKNKFYKIIEDFVNSTVLVHKSMCDFGANLSKNFNISFNKEFDILADKFAYQDFEDNLQSVYMDVKKIRIRINNLCKNINNIIKVES